MKTWKRIAIEGAFALGGIYGVVNYFGEMHRYVHQGQNIIANYEDLRTALGLEAEMWDVWKGKTSETNLRRESFLMETRVRESPEYPNSLVEYYEDRIRNIQNYKKILTPELKDKMKEYDFNNENANRSVSRGLLAEVVAIIGISSLTLTLHSYLTRRKKALTKSP